MKEWLEVTFMKEWGKPLYISSLYPLDLPQNLFPCPSTGHLKFAGVQLNFYIVNFLVCQSSCFIPISTMALNSSATVMTLHEQRVMTPSKMTLLLCLCKFFDDNTVDDFVSFVERSSVDIKKTPMQFKCCRKGCWHNSQEDDMLASFLLWTSFTTNSTTGKGWHDKVCWTFLRESFSSLPSLGHQKWVSTFP